MSDSNRDLVLRYLHAMCSGDAAGAAACLAPDAISVAKGFSALSGVRPPEVFRAMLGALTKLVPGGLQPRIESVTASDNRVVVEFVGDAVTADGKPYCNEYCMVFTLGEGGITLVNEYFCTKLAEDTLLPLLATLADDTPWR